MRRKYDSLKYVSRALENMVCELSFINKFPKLSDNPMERFQSKDKNNQIVNEAMPDLYNDSDLVNTKEFDDIQQRMDIEDAAREKAIKLSRDVQKLSKRAVYSIQRGSLEDGHDKLMSAQQIIIEILLLIKEVCTFKFDSFYSDNNLFYFTSFSILI
jgi:hypothetical protein